MNEPRTQRANWCYHGSVRCVWQQWTTGRVLISSNSL